MELLKRDNYNKQTIVEKLNLSVKEFKIYREFIDVSIKGAEQAIKEIKSKE